MKQAFVLGAGKGTRLKSLTDALPKPLIPLHQKPLITYAFDHLISVGFDQFMVNTHHLPKHYSPAFPDDLYRNCPLSFRFEELLLETGGGIANITDWLPKNESFMVYNGDILSDMNLAAAIETHQNSSNLVTLVLRSQGEALQIAWHPETEKITDIRNSLQTAAKQLYQFTGIYLVRPDFLNFLTPGKKKSVIPAFMALIEQDSLGGVVTDDGTWSDLGTRGTYLRASAALSTNGFPQYGRQSDQQRIHPSAQIHPTAHICPLSSIGQNCVIAADARIDHSILWAGSHVESQASLRNVIVRGEQHAAGILLDADV